MTIAPSSFSWTFSKNRTATTGGAAYESIRRCFYEIKAGIVAATDWTVAQSSNGASAGAADYIASYTDCVWASGASAHTWIVWATPWGQILVDCNFGTTSAHTLSFYLDPSSGFSGGTTTARPTSGTSLTLFTSRTWLPNGTTNEQRRITVMGSELGVRISVWGAGVERSGWIFDEIVSQSTSYSGGLYARVNSAPWASAAIDDANGCVNDGGTIVSSIVTCPWYADGAAAGAYAGNVSNQIDATAGYALLPFLLRSNDATYPGNMGYMRDFYYIGDTPADGDRDTDDGWEVWGNVVVPSNSTTLEKT